MDLLRALWTDLVFDDAWRFLFSGIPSVSWRAGDVHCAYSSHQHLSYGENYLWLFFWGPQIVRLEESEGHWD